jgi:HAD superfamily hydrolase (TIGR01450 family)
MRIGQEVQALLRLAVDNYFENKELVVFDLDGTLVLGKQPLPGAIELVNGLRDSGVQVAFITNDTGYTKEEKAARLTEAGVPVLDADKELLNPLDSVVYYVRESDFAKPYISATPSVRAWIESRGIEHEEDEPDLIVLCRDSTIDYAGITRITQLVFEGVPYIVGNGDSFYPTPQGPGLDMAGMIEAISATTGGVRPLRVFGKPHVSMMESAARPRKIAPEKVLMVGDRLNTDIRMAENYGCDSVVVLSGDTTPEKLRTTDVKATHVVDGVQVLYEQLLAASP